MKKLSFTSGVLYCLAQNSTQTPKFVYVEAPKGIPFGSDGPALPQNPEEFNRDLERSRQLGDAMKASLPSPEDSKAKKAETHAETRAQVEVLKQSLETTRVESPEENERNRVRQEAKDLLVLANGALNKNPETPANLALRKEVLAAMEPLKPALDKSAVQNDLSYQTELGLAKSLDPKDKVALLAKTRQSILKLMYNTQTLREKMTALEGKAVEPDFRGTVTERQNRYNNRLTAEDLLKRTEKVLADTNLQKVNFELFKQIAALRDNVKGNLGLSYKAETDLQVGKGDAAMKNQMRLMAEKISNDQAAKNNELETKLNTIAAA